MLMIRFQRIGRTNDPAFRIAVMDKERAAKTGNIVEHLGTYNPRSKALTLDEGRVKDWISKGAQPTDSIRNLLINKGVIEGKKVNALPKKTPQKNEAAIAAEAEAAKAAAAPAVEESPAPAEETPAETAPAEAEVPAVPTEAEVVAEAEPAPEESAPAEEAPAEIAAETAEEKPAS